MKKKILAMALSLCMILSLLPVPALAVSDWAVLASGFDQCKSLGYSTYGWENYYTGSYWGAAAGHNCTNYCAWRLIQNGATAQITGNANRWAANAQSAGYTVNQTPAVGAIAQWDGTTYYGGSSIIHVAYVEEVGDGYIKVSEDGASIGFEWRTIYQGSNTWPVNFIHFNTSGSGTASCTSHTKGTFLFAEALHPHYNYYSCATCGAKFTDSSTTYVASCADCNPSLSVTGLTQCLYVVRIPANYELRGYSATTSTDSDRKISAKTSAYTLSCQWKVTLSDGSTRYVYSYDSGTTSSYMYFTETSDMTVTVVHNYTTTGTETAHPHRAYQQCTCGYIRYTDSGSTVDGCTQCSAASSDTTTWQETATPVVTIDYETGTIAVTTDMQWCEDPSGESGIITALWDDDLTIGTSDDYAYYLYFGNTVYFRARDTDTQTYTGWYRLEIPEQPAAPTGLTAQAGGISGTTRSMEYRLYDEESDTGWKSCAGSETTDLSAGTYEVRYRATSAKFASACVRLKVTAATEDSGQTGRFTDVPADAYYTAPVAWAVEQGVTTGTSGTTFRPGKTCTRGEVATFLWRSAGKPAVGGQDYMGVIDIDSDDYYYDAIYWAVVRGIANGTKAEYSNLGELETLDITFSPDAPCTRAQVVTFLYRAAGEPDPDAAASFSDVKAGTYYYDAVQWAVSEGITKGTSADAFSPDAPCTRAQVVTFLYRAAKQ